MNPPNSVITSASVLGVPPSSGVREYAVCAAPCSRKLRLPTVGGNCDMFVSVIQPVDCSPIALVYVNDARAIYDGWTSCIPGVAAVGHDPTMPVLSTELADDAVSVSDALALARASENSDVS